MFQDLDAIYARYQQAENIPGLVYGVVQNGKLVERNAPAAPRS